MFLIISDAIILLPYSLVYLSGRSFSAYGGRWPSTETFFVNSLNAHVKSRRVRGRERDKMVNVY